MSNLSQDDLSLGTSRRLIPSSVYGIGESGEFNLQPVSGPGVMTMTDFTGEEPQDCDECEEEKEALVELLETCNTNLTTCSTDLADAEVLIVFLNQQYCDMRALTESLLGTTGNLTYFETQSAEFDISDGTNPNPITVTLIILKDANGWVGYHSSTGPSNLFKWTIRGPEDPLNPGTYSPSLGPKSANETGLTFFNVDPALWLGKQLTYNGYYSLLPQTTQTNGSFGRFKNEGEYIDLCQS